MTFAKTRMDAHESMNLDFMLTLARYLRKKVKFAENGIYVTPILPKMKWLIHQLKGNLICSGI
jgi:hypothetical protein